MQYAIVAFLTCILGRHGACKHLGCSERAASGRRDPVGAASRNRVYVGVRTARVVHNTRATKPATKLRASDREAKCGRNVCRVP